MELRWASERGEAGVGKRRGGRGKEAMRAWERGHAGVGKRRGGRGKEARRAWGEAGAHEDDASVGKDHVWERSERGKQANVGKGKRGKEANMGKMRACEKEQAAGPGHDLEASRRLPRPHPSSSVFIPVLGQFGGLAILVCKPTCVKEPLGPKGSSASGPQRS
eukprot:363585-Chlamydomonas_euryale.AAC.7